MLDFLIRLPNLLFSFFLQRPILMLLVMAIPFFCAARWRRIYPTRTLLFLFTLITAFSVLVIFHPIVWWIAVGLDIILMAVAAFDFFTVPGPKHFEAKRIVQRIASLGKPHNIELELINKSNLTCNILVKDDLHQDFVAEPASFETLIGGTSRALFNYQVTSSNRGRYLLENLYLRITSSLTLWQVMHQLPVRSDLYVYPDMRQIAEYDLLARTNRLSLVGVRRTRKIGQDNEFERLRDYTTGDNYKNIDWRSTARRRKLTVKDFQANQSQRIVFMLDCGRLMTGMSGKFDVLDHALNAILMLSYVALKQGDAVGLLCFSDGIHSFTPPRTGLRHISRLLNATFDQKASYVESRYDEAFLYLQQNSPKRSLVVLVSNVIDEVNANQLLQFTSQLSGRHLPLCVFARDHDLFQMVDEYASDPDGADDETLFNAAASADVLSWRRQVITDLQHRGVLAVETFPEDMTAKLVNQYLEIKARHLL